MLVIYGAPVLLIAIAILSACLSVIKHMQDNKSAFFNYVATSALSCAVGGFLMYELWM